MLAAAAAEADRLVVGVDASAAAMAEASRRAARRPAWLLEAKRSG